VSREELFVLTDQSDLVFEKYEHVTETEQRPAKTLEWLGEIPGKLRLIDQTLLPTELKFLDCETVETVWEAIKSLRVRGAPAIGVSAAYGVIVGVQSLMNSDRAEFNARFDEVTKYLASSRPTAVNLFWALDRLQSVRNSSTDCSSKELLERLLTESREIDAEDQQMCAAIGQYGAE